MDASLTYAGTLGPEIRPYRLGAVHIGLAPVSFINLFFPVAVTLQQKETRVDGPQDAVQDYWDFGSASRPLDRVSLA